MKVTGGEGDGASSSPSASSGGGGGSIGITSLRVVPLPRTDVRVSSPAPARVAAGLPQQDEAGVALLATVSPFRGGEPPAVVPDRGDQPTALEAHGHPHAVALGMLDDVAQCLLHHAVDEPLVSLIEALLGALEDPGDLLSVEPGEQLPEG